MDELACKGVSEGVSECLRVWVAATGLEDALTPGGSSSAVW